MHVTNPVCEQLAELQLTPGEGPCLDVLASAAPVLAADLGDNESSRRGPAFTPEAGEHGAGAVFALALIVGAIRAGVMGLYLGQGRLGLRRQSARTIPKPLSAGLCQEISRVPAWVQGTRSWSAALRLGAEFGVRELAEVRSSLRPT
jgi:hypothetical protein